MLFRLVILAALTILFSSCGINKKVINEPMPEPIYGVDIAKLNKGDPAPFDGTEFSPSYLTWYLEWKCKEQGKC